MKSRLCPTWMWVITLLLIFAASGVAQDYRGRIEGLVTDESRAVIAGSNVTLLNVKTGVRVVKQTSETGLYLFDLVDPGAYTVTIEAAGFGRFVVCWACSAVWRCKSSGQPDGGEGLVIMQGLPPRGGV